jgi:hypothetical protein
MPDDPATPDNIDRLLRHLPEDSLAADLVRARHAPGGATPESMKAVLRERLGQARRAYDPDPD